MDSSKNYLREVFPCDKPIERSEKITILTWNYLALGHLNRKVIRTQPKSQDYKRSAAMRILKAEIFFYLYFFGFQMPYVDAAIYEWLFCQGIRKEEFISLLLHTFSILTYGSREEIFLLSYLAA